MELISDPWFYALAVSAVLIVGFSNAGVGGGLGIMAVLRRFSLPWPTS